MERELVDSSVIRSVGYDPDTEVLEVEFRSSKVYRYAMVPPGEVVALLSAKSIGSYFNRVIRTRYETADGTERKGPVTVADVLEQKRKKP